ncbi:MAG: tripartite tricarboxylate transporter substrate-binding protein [Armatimonadota bacterium]|nr:tripartite tricarboxylate transporter substrate-binding protein [Armatimonadota bacterium]MDW8156177.1 tripartite tricarboxylate transporter substrate-binding protein [Armatimonadota bacterium]
MAIRLGLLMALLVVPAWAGAPATAQAAFSGRTVTILVGYSPGGGYDRTARLVSRYLPRYLPGSPTVVVQNMPGANSIVAANHLYNLVRPDGLTIGLFARNLVLAQLVGVEGIRVDMGRWQWIGSPAVETDVLAVRSDLPYRNVLELRRADPPVVFGASGPGDVTYDFPLALRAFLNLNIRVVSGYPGSADIMLAIERKEVDGRAGSWSSLRPFVHRGLIRPLVRTPSDNPELQAIPADLELPVGALAREVLRLRAVPNRLGRPFVAPPATPPNVVAAYREAFRRITEDREFLVEAERAGLEVTWVSGDECLRIVQGVLASPPSVVRVFREFFRFQ